MADDIKIVIAGGGTGGHLYPGIALAQTFEEKWQAKILFVGTAYGLENKILPKMHYDFKKIWMRGLQRKLTPANLLFPLRLTASLLQSLLLLRRFRPDAVVGTGGYVSGPVLLAAILLRIPCVIQEQNSYPGLVNRLLGNYVDQVHISFEASLRYFKKQESLFVSGNPVRSDLNKTEKQSASHHFGLHPEKTTLLIFGGSQGAHAINQQVLQALPELLAISDLQLLWATGPADFEVAAAAGAKFGGHVSVHPYLEEMAAAYAAADFVLCRAGASTLAEIAICALPAILVPYPHAAAGHQEFNARAVAEKGAAVLLLEKELNQKSLVKNVRQLAQNPNRLAQMAEMARQMARPQAAAEIAARMAPLIRKTWPGARARTGAAA